MADTNETPSVYWPRQLIIDGDDNIYLNGGNSQIFIIAPDGSSVKTISSKKTGGLASVDENGNIYGFYNPEGEPSGFIVTKPDGTQNVFKNFKLSLVENGVAYDLQNNKAITIANNDDKPEKLPPRLLKIYKGENDFEKKSYDSFVIFSKKINEHLKKINRQIDTDEVRIKVEEDNGLPVFADLLGVDDNENFYFLCGYTLQSSSLPWEKAYVMVYSQTSQKLAEVPIDLDYFDKHVSGIALDIYGNFFQLLASEDGIHILKWAKN